MKLRLFILFTLLCFVPPCESRAQCTEETPCPEVARLNPVMLGGGAADVELSCNTTTPYAAYDDTPGLDEALHVGVSADYIYSGMAGYSPATNIQVCRISFYVYSVIGTPPNYTAQIWAMSGDNLTGTALGTSGTCTSVAATTWCVCEFASPVSIYSGTEYSIVMSSGTFDAENYIRLGGDNNNVGLDGGSGSWQADLDIYSDYVNPDTRDLYIKIYTMQ